MVTARQSAVPQVIDCPASRDCSFQILVHPAYSPDLASRNYYLFKHLESHLRGTKFEDDESVMCGTNAWFMGQPEEFYFKSTTCLPNKWNKSVEHKKQYIKN